MEIRALKKGDDEWISDAKEIKCELVSFFKQGYEGVECNSNPSAEEWLQHLPCISQDHVNMLHKPFSTEEIRKAAFAPHPLKSPDPDGAPPLFFQRHWNVIKNEVVEGVQFFFRRGHMLRETNRTFLALISKCSNPETVTDFRPIGLCNSLYKIISKCMVNRLKPILKEVIGEFQNAFILGRMMLDNCFIAHEILHEVKHRKKGGRFEAILKIELSKAYDRGLLQGIKISRRAPSISHLFFADDALFYFKATPASIRVVKETLQDFCQLSGEVINMKKSSILFSPNTPSRFVRILRQPLGIRSNTELGTYLGCPMDIDGRTFAKLKGVQEKIMKIISSWKFSHLTMPGKIILINGVLAASLQHILSVYWCPKSLANSIMSILLKFLWRNSTAKKPIYWAKKSLICSHKTSGGLGIRSVMHLNKSLLMKQGWRMITNHGLLVSRIFKSKYGNDLISLGHKDLVPKFGSWAARSIVKAASELKQHIGFSVGDARKLISKGIFGLVWRAFNEEDTRNILSIYLPSAREDKRVWLPGLKGSYSVKSGYWSQFNQQPLAEDNWFWRKYWKINIWRKVLLGWRILQNKLHTKDNLNRRGVKLEEYCVLCTKEEENVAHLFRECEVTRRIWWGLLGIRTMSNSHIPFQKWLKDLLAYSLKNDKGSDTFLSMPLIMPAIWLHRNDITFRGMSANPADIVELAQVHAQR
ncbi:uncharacterized protein LOC110710043 [Chenopodium quinoa]|uniref:uncharacterized protein LOC110710043 n=1 Tax=Chenopodium quinoa TaxID=63459 RepID=UPI000B798A1D|nr:uncharacterized protein LOC110710043 [Chenopodium quinoa]